MRAERAEDLNLVTVENTQVISPNAQPVTADSPVTENRSAYAVEPRRLKFDQVSVEIHPTRESASEAAARAIVRRALHDPIATDCPATILRTHPGTTIFLDAESASELDE
jgi:hypothetical protein